MRAKIHSPELRLVKTPYERKVLVKSFDISNDAQMAGMRAARPGAYEYEVKAAIEAVHYGRGAPPLAIRRLLEAGRTRRSSITLTARARCKPASSPSRRRGVAAWTT